MQIFTRMSHSKIFLKIGNYEHMQYTAVCRHKSLAHLAPMVCMHTFAKKQLQSTIKKAAVHVIYNSCNLQFKKTAATFPIKRKLK